MDRSRRRAWLGPGQDRLYALAAEMGVPTYAQYVAGDNVFELHGKVHRYRGLTPTGIGYFALACFGIGFTRLDRMARRIPIDAPWTAPGAARLDAISCEAWIRSWWRCPSRTGRELLRLSVEAIFATPAAEVSLLNLLAHVHAAGLSGETIAIGSPVSITIDGCTPAATPGIPHAFIASREAQTWPSSRLPRGARSSSTPSAIASARAPPHRRSIWSRSGPTSRGRAAAPWRTTGPASSRASAPRSASLSVGCTSRAPQPRRARTASSTGPYARARAAAEVVAALAGGTRPG